MLKYPCVYRNLQKYEECLSEIFKRTRPGKPDAEEASHIEVCMEPNIQEKYNLTPKNSPVDYANMLLPLNNMQGKNKCCPFSNWHTGKI